MAHLFLVHFAKQNHAFATKNFQVTMKVLGLRAKVVVSEGWYKNGPSKTVGYVDENPKRTPTYNWSD